MLARVGLADRSRDWPAVLSGGQRQRVALPRALAGDPRLLLLDEPLGSLDALTRIEMQRLIEGLWSAGRFTTVLITHDVDEAVTLADRVVRIAAGRVAGEWPVPLPRPRRRDDPAFGPLVRTILDAVMTPAPGAQI
jgi:sulfonate transport system ATP-binding protein